jgi:hypothetical protein
MKEQKPFGSQSGGFRSVSTDDANGRGGPTAERTAVGSADAQERLKPKPRPPMQNETQTRKPRGRLGRDVQSKLGKTLQAYFDDVVKEGVPERFRHLLQQYDRNDKGST